MADAEPPANFVQQDFTGAGQDQVVVPFLLQIEAFDFMLVLIPEFADQRVHIVKLAHRDMERAFPGAQEVLIGDNAQLIHQAEPECQRQEAHQAGALFHAEQEKVNRTVAVVYCFVEVVNRHAVSLLPKRMSSSHYIRNFPRRK